MTIPKYASVILWICQNWAFWRFLGLRGLKTADKLQICFCKVWKRGRSAMQWVKSLYSPPIGRSLCTIRCTVLTDRNTAVWAPLCGSMCLHSHAARARARAHGFIKSNALTVHNTPLPWTHNKENDLTNTPKHAHTLPYRSFYQFQRRDVHPAVMVAIK